MHNAGGSQLPAWQVITALIAPFAALSEPAGWSPSAAGSNCPSCPRGFGLQWVAGCRHLPPGRSRVGIQTWGLLGSQELPRAHGRALPGCLVRPQPSPASATQDDPTVGGDTPALHPWEWSIKAGDGLHRLQAGSIGTANLDPSLPPIPNVKFS